MGDRAIHARVTGRVQRVGFRQGCRQLARSLSLAGWVRNLSDGSVEVFAQGDASAVDSLVDWLWAGPGGAFVTGVETDNVAFDDTVRDFFIHPNPAKTF